MTEEKTTTTAAGGEPATTLEGSAFARVLGRLLEARGIPADEGHALELAERSGVNPGEFRARLAGDLNSSPGDLLNLAKNLDLSGSDMKILARAYAYEEEEGDEEGSGLKRLLRPEEIVAHYEELPNKQRVQPLRCRAGSKSENLCPREATTWMYPGDRDYPMCGEHARANELSREAMDRDITESVTADWLRIARTWGFEDLEQLAINAHESAKEESLKAEARAALAYEIADASREGRRERVASLTREQDQKLRELLRRGDSLNDAYTTLEDAPLEQFGDEKARRRILAVLASERDKGWEEAYRYKEELGLHVVGSEKSQPESGVGKPLGGEQACA